MTTSRILFVDDEPNVLTGLRRILRDKRQPDDEGGARADLKTDFDDALPPVPCLPGEFNQVMLNLIVNAAHAIEEADKDQPGAITVATRAVDGWAEIRVSDTGIGIETENLRRIFDMFFTTKPPGKGTGQGLAICHTIVTQKHGGTITVESEEGTGATFIVRLPIIPADAAQAAAE